MFKTLLSDICDFLSTLALANYDGLAFEHRRANLGFGKDSKWGEIQKPANLSPHYARCPGFTKTSGREIAVIVSLLAMDGNNNVDSTLFR